MNHTITTHEHEVIALRMRFDAYRVHIKGLGIFKRITAAGKESLCESHRETFERTILKVACLTPRDYTQLRSRLVMQALSAAYPFRFNANDSYRLACKTLRGEICKSRRGQGLDEAAISVLFTHVFVVAILDCPEITSGS